MDKPNVLFLMVDQHNAKCLGCYGHPIVQTPQIDRIASNGVRFTSAFVQSPICSPSRMCFLTGQYAHNHGYYGLRGPLPAHLPNMFSHFKSNGYHTGAIGKVHLSENWIEPDCDFFCEAVLGRSKCPGQTYEEFISQHGIDDPEDDITRQRLASGAFLESVDGRPDFLPKELSREGFAVKMAQEFLTNKPKDQPFFLWFSLNKPHPEYKPAKEFWDLYPEEIPLPPSARDGVDDRVSNVRRVLNEQRTNPPAEVDPKTYEALLRRSLRGYYANITHADWTIGEVMKTLEEQGLLENTLVVFSSDHGDFACEHGLLEKAPGVSSDAVCRVPLIWSWPGRIPKGEVRDQLVETIDLWPTFAGFAGLPQLSMWDGKDLSGIITNNGGEIRDAAFSENPFIKSVTTQRWRMAYVPAGMFPGDPVRAELYDRVNDPWERRNLFHDPAYASVVSELKERLLDWLITSSHPISALPVLPHPSLDWTNSDPINDNRPYPEDGKTSPDQIWKAIRSGLDNYL